MADWTRWLRTVLALIGLSLCLAWCFLIALTPPTSSSLLFANGFAMALYGLLLCFAGPTIRFYVVGSFIFFLGVSHVFWSLIGGAMIGFVAYALLKGNPRLPQDAFNFASMFLLTGFVFGTLVAIASRSWICASLMGLTTALATAISVASVTVLGMDGFVAAIVLLHLGIGGCLFAAVMQRVWFAPLPIRRVCCRQCGYSLVGLRQAVRCPECGASVDGGAAGVEGACGTILR